MSKAGDTQTTVREREPTAHTLKTFRHIPRVMGTPTQARAPHAFPFPNGDYNHVRFHIPVPPLFRGRKEGMGKRFNLQRKGKGKQIPPQHKRHPHTYKTNTPPTNKDTPHTYTPTQYTRPQHAQEREHKGQTSPKNRTYKAHDTLETANKMCNKWMPRANTQSKMPKAFKRGRSKEKGERTLERLRTRMEIDKKESIKSRT